MTAITAPACTPAASTTRHAAKAAGFTYVAAWVVGPTAFGVGPGTGASSAEVADHFANHRMSTTIQSFLVHGVAAAALLVVLTAMRRTQTSTRTAFLGGVTGVALSVTQLALGAWRSLIATGSTTTALVDAIDRIDGFKMFAFAVMIGAGVGALRRAGVIGPRMATVGVVATVALVISGLAYAAAIDWLVGSAALSLVLLLVWVAYLGVAVARRAA